jgi:hypothetical protein
MTHQEKIDVAEVIAENCIDYIYETVASQLDWHDFNIDDEYDEDQFIIAHEEVTKFAIDAIAKQLTNLNK